MNAFVSTSGVLGISSFRSGSSATCTRQRVAARVTSSRIVPRAIQDADGYPADEDNSQVFFIGPQGWTPFAERLNGRLAQLGFVLALVTEAISGHTLGEQVMFFIAPFLDLATISYYVLSSTIHF